VKNDHPAGPLDFDVSRREMLKQAGLVSVGLAATPVPGWPASWFKQEVTVVPFTDMANYRGASRMAQDLRELTSWLTPTEDFFSIGHYGTPEVDASAYRLQVTGLVERPITLTLDELKARPKVEPTTVFECSGNSRGLVHGMVGNATWAGAALIPLLAEVRPTTDSREVYFWGADTGTEEIRGQEYEQNFARSMSLEHVNETGPILAYEMNGEPLPAAHGFPVRLIVPGWYGIAQVKWLERIELGVDRLMTRFMAKDYVTLMGREENGRTEWLETSVTHQRVKSVIARVTRAEDQFTIFGAAWSDGTPLDRVEVRVDDGAWRAATMDRPDDPHTWTFFTFETEGLTPGEHTLVSRATDVDGRTQPVDLSMKLTRWENNELFERTIQVS
jgi:DMSO/TMAO reductase YedYZ molybdopterin-dependent catalytic subunit|tara:strand:+ start:1034 stop:2197 length:1164 start_codon:yes stop_codon:yes gene_type:complete